jgi:hypothetical protein
VNKERGLAPGVSGLLDRITLAGNIEFRAQGDVPVSFAVNGGRKRSR